MIYTYKNRRKIINWKPNEKKMIVPKNSKPLFNGSHSQEDTNNFTSKFGTARPLKHYRKQLIPYFNTPSSKKISLDDINLSTNSYINETNKLFNPCSSDVTLNFVSGFVLDKPQPCLGSKNNGVCRGGNTNVYYRSATTNVNKDYHQTTKSYLHRKCKTFEQNLKLGENISDETYKMTSCSNNNCNKTIYKPNNKKFSKQGSVESSTRLLRLKNDTINQNGASFRSAFGRQSANAGKYKNSIGNENIFFQKDKYTELKACNNYPSNFRKPNIVKTRC